MIFSTLSMKGKKQDIKVEREQLSAYSTMSMENDDLEYKRDSPGEK